MREPVLEFEPEKNLPVKTADDLPTRPDPATPPLTADEAQHLDMHTNLIEAGWQLDAKLRHATVWHNPDDPDSEVVLPEPFVRDFKPRMREAWAAFKPTVLIVDDPQEPSMQPIVIAPDGVVRFKANAIVRYLLDNGGIDLNRLARLPFPESDRRQFAQLIGYSVSGYGDLSYTEGHASVTVADQIAAGLLGRSQ